MTEKDDNGSGGATENEREAKDETTNAEKILRAEKEIRREGAKAAFLHGTVEATILFVAVFFVLSEFQPDLLPEAVGPVSGEIAAAAGVGVVFLVVDTALVYRRRTLEYFEQVNPQVKEALRTARDAAERGEENEMANALYEDVLEELRTTSSDGFVSIPRMAGSVALVLVVVLLLLFSSFGGLGGIGENIFGEEEFAGGGGDSNTQGGGGSGGGEGEETEGEQSPGDLFGEETDVVRGDELEDLEVDSSGVGSDGSGSVGGTGTSGEGRDYTGDVDVESQRAEFSPEEEIEDAELVKEYNLRVRGEE